MIKYIAIVIMAVLCIKANAQIWKEPQNKQRKNPLFTTDGAYLSFYDYKINFAKAFNGYVMLDSMKLEQISSTEFHFAARESGYIRAYLYDSEKHAHLVDEQYIKIQDPQFKVYLNQKESGAKIGDKSNRHSWSITANIPNTRYDYHFDIDSIAIGYIENNSVINSYFLRSNVVPDDIQSRIIKSGTPLIIVNVKIKLSDRNIIPSPAIFYLK